MHLKSRSVRVANGFSLLEVLITIVLVSIALLGLAKSQAAAISNTQIARVRSLIALQTTSLAAVMHGNATFWAAGLAPATFTAATTVITDSTNVLSATAQCDTAVCTPSKLAASDVQRWAAGMNAQFPTYTATVSCSNGVAAPVSCTIVVTWDEKYIAINKSTVAAVGTDTQHATQSFTLYVEP